MLFYYPTKDWLTIIWSILEETGWVNSSVCVALTPLPSSVPATGFKPTTCWSLAVFATGKPQLFLVEDWFFSSKKLGSQSQKWNEMYQKFHYLMKIDQSSERIMFKVLKLIVEGQRKSQILFITPLETTKENDSLPRERFFDEQNTHTNGWNFCATFLAIFFFNLIYCSILCLKYL